MNNITFDEYDIKYLQRNYIIEVTFPETYSSDDKIKVKQFCELNECTKQCYGYANACWLQKRMIICDCGCCEYNSRFDPYFITCAT